MVDGHQSFCSGNVQSPSRAQCIPFYGCQSLWMGSSSRADETILSWSQVGRHIPAPYQYSRNNGHSFRTEESHKIHIPLLCHDFYRQYNSGLLAINKEEHISPTYAWRYGSSSIDSWNTISLSEFVIFQVSSIYWMTVFRDWTDLSKQNGLWIIR